MKYALWILIILFTLMLILVVMLLHSSRKRYRDEYLSAQKKPEADKQTAAGQTSGNVSEHLLSDADETRLEELMNVCIDSEEQEFIETEKESLSGAVQKEAEASVGMEAIFPPDPDDVDFPDSEYENEPLHTADQDKAEIPTLVSEEDDAEFLIPEQPDENSNQPEFMNAGGSVHQMSDDDYRYLSEQVNASTQAELLLLQKGLEIAWPESTVMMSKTDFDGAVLYVFEGISRNDSMLLFDLNDEQLIYPVLETIRKISDENQIPKIRPAVLVHAKGTGSQSVRSGVSTYLRSQNRKPSVIISDSGTMPGVSEQLKDFAFITAGRTAYGRFSTDCPLPSVKLIINECVKAFRPAGENDTADDAMERLKKSLPSGTRTSLKALYRNTEAMNRIIALCPQLEYTLRPVFKIEEDSAVQIRMYAPDDEQFDDMLSILRSLMQENGYHLRLESEHGSGSCSDPQQHAYMKVENAYLTASGKKQSVPVLSPENYTWPGSDTFALDTGILTRRQLYQFLELLIR